MTKKRVLAILLALLTLTSVSCSDSTADKGDNSTDDSTAVISAEEGTDESTADEAEEETVTDGLGEYSFDGATFGMMTFQNQNFNYQMLSEELLATPLNDAIYNATQRIEERFDIDLTQILYADSSNTPSVTVTSGDTSADLIRLRCGEAVTWWQQNLLVTADEVPFIDLSKPYWDKTINESLTIANTHYIALSAFDLCSYDLTFALTFNKDFIKDFNLADPYETVKNGEWTIDKMNEMMLTVVSDADGNGKWDTNDRYGYLASPKMVSPGFWIGANVKSIEKDENDIPYLNIGSEEFIALWEKMLAVTHNEHQWFGIDDGPDIPTITRKMFSENKGLFMDMSFYFAEELRTMESDFGIIPYPKFDESQQDYRARLCYVVPITKVDEELDRCGIILEALACEYYNNVIPAYYDIVLQYKVARDVESQGMLDIIFDSRVVDIGDSTMCGDLRDGILRMMFEANFPNVTSKAKALENVINSKLEKLPGVSH